MPYECLAKYRQVNDKIVQHFLHDVHIISLLEEYMIMYKVVNKWITNTIQMKLEDSNGTITWVQLNWENFILVKLYMLG
jgi:hypothetical protein